MAHTFTQSLSKSQIKFLKSEAHHLESVVSLGGQGITDNLLKEIASSINHHELIKIALPEDLSAGDKNSFVDSELMPALLKITQQKDSVFFGSPIHLVGRLGRKAILYREKNPAEAKYLLLKIK
jgi:RNA-binding protein YhbY